MEVVPLDSASAVADVAADLLTALVSRRPERRWASPPADPAAHLRRARPPPRGGHGHSRACGSSSSTSTSGFARGTTRAGYLATSCTARSPAMGRARPRSTDPIRAACPRAPTTTSAHRRAGGIDVQLLGIGTDGHLGFNEPGLLADVPHPPQDADPRRGPTTRRCSPDGEVPRHVVRRESGTILEARHLLLLATVERRPTPWRRRSRDRCRRRAPGSALQLHPHATVLLDPGAARGLRRLDYYREMWAGKPEWQRD